MYFLDGAGVILSFFWKWKRKLCFRGVAGHNPARKMRYSRYSPYGFVWSDVEATLKLIRFAWRRFWRFSLRTLFASKATCFASKLTPFVSNVACFASEVICFAYCHTCLLSYLPTIVLAYDHTCSLSCQLATIHAYYHTITLVLSKSKKMRNGRFSPHGFV